MERVRERAKECSRDPGDGVGQYRRSGEHALEAVEHLLDMSCDRAGEHGIVVISEHRAGCRTSNAPGGGRGYKQTRLEALYGEMVTPHGI
eukprot:254293-Amorphochlora_amoeboformis.AAC.2